MVVILIPLVFDMVMNHLAVQTVELRGWSLSTFPSFPPCSFFYFSLSIPEHVYISTDVQRKIETCFQDVSSTCFFRFKFPAFRLPWSKVTQNAAVAPQPRRHAPGTSLEPAMQEGKVRMKKGSWINHWSITNHWSSTASWGLRPQACNGSMCCTWQLARQVSNKVGHHVQSSGGTVFHTKYARRLQFGASFLPTFHHDEPLLCRNVHRNSASHRSSSGKRKRATPAFLFHQIKARESQHSGGLLKGRIDWFWELCVFPFCFFFLDFYFLASLFRCLSALAISVFLLLCCSASLLCLLFCFPCFFFLFLKPEQSLRYIIENKP